MKFKEVAKMISKMAPLLGSVLGGPVGGAVGGVVTAIANLFGVDPDEAQNNPSVLVEAIEKDPEAAIKLKELENNLRIELQKLLIEQDKMMLADIAGARQREIEIVKATGHRDINLFLLAWIVILGFFSLCGILMYRPLPQGSNQVVFMLFGALSAGFGQVLQYFFGTSKSSNEKTKLIAQRNLYEQPKRLEGYKTF